MIKRLIKHIIWFNRKSQHYKFGDWLEYVKDDVRYDIKWGTQRTQYTLSDIYKYKLYYPIALFKFLWFSRWDILTPTTKDKT